MIFWKWSVKRSWDNLGISSLYGLEVASLIWKRYVNLPSNVSQKGGLGSSIYSQWSAFFFQFYIDLIKSFMRCHLLACYRLYLNPDHPPKEPQFNSQTFKSNSTAPDLNHLWTAVLELHGDILNTHSTLIYGNTTVIVRLLLGVTCAGESVQPPLSLLSLACPSLYCHFMSWTWH